MKSLVIKYRLWGFIPLRFRRSIPEKWEDLSPPQLVAIGSLYANKVKDDGKLVTLLYRLPAFVTRKMPPFHVYQLVGKLDFLKDFKPLTHFIIRNIDGNRPPRPRLENMPFGQFVFADTYFINYARLDDKTMLHKLIATLYTPAGLPFNEETIGSRAEKMAALPEATKQAVLINYRLMKEWLTEAYPMLFLRPEDKPDRKKPAEEKPGKEKTLSFSDDWLKIFDNLVSEDLVNADKYATMPVHTVFRFITRKIKENAKRA